MGGEAPMCEEAEERGDQWPTEERHRGVRFCAGEAP